MPRSHKLYTDQTKLDSSQTFLSLQVTNLTQPELHVLILTNNNATGTVKCLHQRDLTLAREGKVPTNSNISSTASNKFAPTRTTMYMQ